MIELSVQVNGVEQVVARLEGMTAAIRERLRTTLEQVGPELRDSIISGAPARAADHKDSHAGKLRRSIKSKVSETGDAVQLKVGPPVFYGRFLELGIPEKTITVTRRGLLGRGIVGVRTKLTKSGTVLVSAKRGKVEIGQGATYTRRFHIDARPFVTPAFDAMRDRIMAGINDAIRQGIGK